jgi:hypothetical protein
MSPGGSQAGSLDRGRCGWVEIYMHPVVLGAPDDLDAVIRDFMGIVSPPPSLSPKTGVGHRLPAAFPGADEPDRATIAF